jgi:hypothetical protein
MEMILELFLDWTISDNTNFFKDKIDIFIPPLLKQFPSYRQHSCKKRELLLLTVFAGLNFSLLAQRQVVIVPINIVVIQKLHFLLMGLLSFLARKIHHTLAYEMAVQDNQIYSDVGNSATLLSKILLDSATVLIDCYCDKAHESFKTILECWTHSLDLTNSMALLILEEFDRNLCSLSNNANGYSSTQSRVNSID